MAPPGNQAANCENKPQPRALEETDLIDLGKWGGKKECVPDCVQVSFNPFRNFVKRSPCSRGSLPGLFPVMRHATGRGQLLF